MVFSSFYFLFYFLPFFLICYFLVSNEYKNICIFIFSLCFYAFGCMDSEFYVIILIISLFLNYLFAILIERVREKKIIKNFIFLITIFLNLGLLFYFKYFDFFVEILKNFGREIFTKHNLLLPIGISFYTFQILSYVIDVYWEKITAEKNFINLSTYIIMFPQLIAGPIIRYEDVREQITKKKISKEYIIDGASIFIIGLTSKVLVANQLSGVSIDINNYGIENLSTAMAWVGGISYFMQLYFDFFGYSLMAIGLGKIIGFDIMENFNNPFFARTVSDYWRRWHISLGIWFKDYLFYPLLRSKTFVFFRKFIIKISNKKIANVIINVIALFITWFLIGLWHGANYNYIIHGIYFAIFMILEEIVLGKILNKLKIINHIYLLIVITVSMVIFSNENMIDLKNYLSAMFYRTNNLIDNNFYKIVEINILPIIIGVATVLNIPKIIYKKIKNILVIRLIILCILLGIDIYLLYRGFNDPFMYFRF